jgi:ABC-type transport system involved in multi-copper enzyme maturation permease subunit
MSDLIRAELLKLRTTRTFWWSVVAALAFVPVSVALAMQMAGQAGSPTPTLDSSEGVRNVMSAAASGAQILLVIGILIMAGEFRHNTATSTFLISPDRKRVVGAKLAAASLVGVGVTVAASVLTLAIALPWLAANHVEVSLLSGDVAVPLLGALAATVLYPLVGVGVGALLRNQTVAVTVALVWVLVVEGVLVGFAPAVGRWLPGGAGSALTGVATAKGGLLPMWGAALLLAGYGLAFAAASTRLITRRDIT